MITREQANQIFGQYAARVAALPAELAPEMARFLIDRVMQEFAVDLTERHKEAEQLLTEFCQRQMTNTLLKATERFNARHSTNPASL